MSRIYLASPYTHDDKQVEQQRFEAACAYAARLMLEGYHVYSPIAHGHAIALHGGHALPTDWGFWRGHCTNELTRCDSMIVLQLDGWSVSTGVGFELEVAAGLCMPVEFCAPGQLPLNIPRPEVA